MPNDSIEWVAIYRSTSETNCREQALVLHAAGIEHAIRREADECTLLVPVAHAERGLAELSAYASENRDWSAVRPAPSRRGNGLVGVLGFAVLMIAMAVLEHQNAFGIDWMETGKTHAASIRSGEWWRTVTALSLHADVAHLIGNLVIGGIVGLFAGQSFGSGRAWFSILIAGAIGNLINALIRPVDHSSVGASTAVFAALGLLSASAWRQRRRSQTSWLERWAPLIGGVILLSYLGTGGGRTDVAAHVFGFFAGAVLGALFGKVSYRAESTVRTQFLFGFAAIAIICVAWALALMRTSRTSIF